MLVPGRLHNNSKSDQPSQPRYRICLGNLDQFFSNETRTTSSSQSPVGVTISPSLLSLSLSYTLSPVRAGDWRYVFTDSVASRSEKLTSLWRTFRSVRTFVVRIRIKMNMRLSKLVLLSSISITPCVAAVSWHMYRSVAVELRRDVSGYARTNKQLLRY